MEVFFVCVWELVWGEEAEGVGLGLGWLGLHGWWLVDCDIILIGYYSFI